MRAFTITSIAFCFMLLMACSETSVDGGTSKVSSYYDAAGKHFVVPSEGFVPDADTAEKIAEVVWIPIYGKDNIEEQKPFKSKLIGNVWVVEGTLPENYLGGVALAEISKTDGCIIRVSHGS